MLTRTTTLANIATYPANESHIEELKEISNIRAKLALEAEKKCRKLRCGAVAFAPEDVQRYAYQINLWKLVIAKLSGGKVCSKVLLRASKQCNIEKPWLVSITEAKQNRNEALKNYLKAKPTARVK